MTLLNSDNMEIWWRRTNNITTEKEAQDILRGKNNIFTVTMTFRNLNSEQKIIVTGQLHRLLLSFWGIETPEIRVD